MVNTTDDQHQTWTTEVEKFCLPKNPHEWWWLRQQLWYGGIYTFLFLYTIKFTLSSLPTKSFVMQFHGIARMCWSLSEACVLISMDVLLSVCACLTLWMCMCSQTILYMCIGMPANEIERTETIWMNKLHIMLKINERYFNWIEFFLLLLYVSRASKRTRTNCAYTNE